MSLKEATGTVHIEDTDLSTAWRVIRRFCLLVDLATQTQRSLRPDLIGDTMASTMYQLLSMKFDAGSIDEAVRYGLLVFAYHVFLQWKDIRLPYRSLPEAYKTCIVSLEDDASPQLILWLLFVGAISVWDISAEPWLRDRLRRCAGKCGVRKWKDVHTTLKEIAWVPVLDEQVGQQLYRSLGLGASC